MRLSAILLTFLMGIDLWAQSVNLQAGTATGVHPGQVFDLPIVVNTDLTGLGVRSFQLSVTKPSTCTFQNVIVDPGDLLHGVGTPVANATTTVLIAWAGTAPLSGSGTLLRLRFQANSTGTTNIQFTPAGSNLFNEGSPTLSFTNGSVSVTPGPVITVNPASAVLIPGEALTLTASGGTAPYLYSSTDPAVGTVSGGSWTAVAQGLGKAQAEDAISNTGTNSGWYDVRTFDLDIGSATGYTTQELRVPLTMKDPSGTGFYTGDIRVDGHTALQFTGLDVAGYLLDGMNLQTNTSGASVYLSFADAMPRSPMGTDTLGWLRYEKPDPGAGNYTLSIGGALFDETHNVRAATGSLSFQNLPAIGITPGTGSVQAGLTLLFATTGAVVPPVAWSVSDPTVGSIDAAGLFTALDNGTVQISLIDAIGNTASTGTIQVWDALLKVEDVQAPVGGDVWVPVTLGPSVNNEDVRAFSIDVGFDATRLAFVAWESIGTLSDGWLAATSTSAGTLSVVAASADPFQPGGVIGYAHFEVLPAFTSGTTTVTLLSSLFNEGDPVVLHDHGVLTASNGGCVSPGCTNPYACNYDPDAVCDDGSCAFSGPDCIAALALRVMLEGPYDTGSGLMDDDLRATLLLPSGEPYTALSYSYTGTGGGVSADPGAFAASGSDAIVDWVVVELRDAALPATVVHSRPALLQRDGDVVDLDGVSTLDLSAHTGDHHIAVRHRNHLGCMTSDPVHIATGPIMVDLTSPTTTTYGTGARKDLGGTMVLWAGDVTFDGLIKYVGAGNDRDPILAEIGGTVPTAISSGYKGTDVNLDGVIKYAGPSNDRDIILTNIGGSVPTSVKVQQLP